MKGLLVEDAMRRQVIRAPQDMYLGQCVNQLIKFKAGALLVGDKTGCPVGVVSKTDIVGAFYGGLPIAQTLAIDIMNGPALTCFPDDELGGALDLMRKNGVHQLFVQGAEPCAVVGTLSYGDVVALLYRYCRACPQGAAGLTGSFDRTQFLTVRDAMKTCAVSRGNNSSLAEAIEELTTHHSGAVLIVDGDGLPSGVISRTDIVLAYHHGASLEAEAQTIATSPVASCDENFLLTEAIRQMFLKDLQRLFAYAKDPAHITGVLSLSDAAQMRSGSCRACMASRIIVSSY
ncbi:MAG: CBS domain-containing protein [Syntrophobacteraceae bacterium]|nr:CBS domain-containing protein [Syntrophobacteraceae bacterium]